MVVQDWTMDFTLIISLGKIREYCCYTVDQNPSFPSSKLKLLDKNACSQTVKVSKKTFDQKNLI